MARFNVSRNGVERFDIVIPEPVFVAGCICVLLGLIGFAAS